MNKIKHISFPSCNLYLQIHGVQIFTSKCQSDCCLKLIEQFSSYIMVGTSNISIRWFSVRVMVFNATFNNISVISWQSVLLVEETGVPRENH